MLRGILSRLLRRYFGIASGVTRPCSFESKEVFL